MESSDTYRALARPRVRRDPGSDRTLEEDDRLTRYPIRDGAENWVDYLRVKDLAYRLLCALRGPITDRVQRHRGAYVRGGAWFADAQKMGEEEYVVTHVGVRDSPHYDVLLPLLVEKYPKRLPEAYRNFIDKQKKWNHLGDPFAQAIVESAIPREDKLKVSRVRRDPCRPLSPVGRHPAISCCWIPGTRRNCSSPRRTNNMPSSPEHAELRLVWIVGHHRPMAWAAAHSKARRSGHAGGIALLGLRVLGRPEPGKPAKPARVRGFAPDRRGSVGRDQRPEAGARNLQWRTYSQSEVS